MKQPRQIPQPRPPTCSPPYQELLTLLHPVHLTFCLPWSYQELPAAKSDPMVRSGNLPS